MIHQMIKKTVSALSATVIISSIACNFNRIDRTFVIPIVLPSSTIPFNPLPAPRANLHPMGAKPEFERSDAEQYLHALLKIIVAGHPSMFTGILKPDNFRFEYHPDMTRTATVDLSQIIVKVSPRFFALVHNDAQAAAILSHEVSHILLGHPEFNQVPDLVRKHPFYQDQLAAIEAAREDLQLENMAAIFEQYKIAGQALKERYEQVYPGKLKPLLSAWQNSSGKEAQKLQAEIRQLLDSFANEDSSPKAQAYQVASLAEHDYNARLERFNQLNANLNNVIDDILMEPGAASNWKEQEADELGFRLFIRAGFKPQVFLQTLAATLGNDPGGLLSYLQDIEHCIESGMDPATIPVPARGASNHPAPRWRIYNLLVRELTIRYPEKYRELQESAQELSDTTEPLGDWFSTLSL